MPFLLPLQIDFQLCFYGSLGFDINYFLNTSLELEVLRDRRQELVDLHAHQAQAGGTHVEGGG